MMKKIVIPILVTLLLVGVNNTNVHAEEDSNLIFSGDAEAFVLVEDGDLFNNMKNMMPGETRKQVIQLKNTDERALKFFLKVEVEEALDENTNYLGVYEIKLKSDDEVIYEGKINGLKNFSEGGMKDNEILLADLKEGQTSNVEFSLYLDGDSMDNTYQEKEGSILFHFSVEQQDPRPQEVIVNIIDKIVHTGDTMWRKGYVALIGVSGAIILLLIWRRKKEAKR